MTMADCTETLSCLLGYQVESLEEKSLDVLIFYIINTMEEIVTKYMKPRCLSDVLQKLEKECVVIRKWISTVIPSRFHQDIFDRTLCMYYTTRPLKLLRKTVYTIFMLTTYGIIKCFLSQHVKYIDRLEIKSYYENSSFMYNSYFTSEEEFFCTILDVIENLNVTIRTLEFETVKLRHKDLIKKMSHKYNLNTLIINNMCIESNPFIDIISSISNNKWLQLKVIKLPLLVNFTKLLGIDIHNVSLTILKNLPNIEELIGTPMYDVLTQLDKNPREFPSTPIVYKLKHFCHSEPDGYSPSSRSHLNNIEIIKMFPSIDKVSLWTSNQNLQLAVLKIFGSMQNVEFSAPPEENCYCYLRECTFLKIHNAKMISNLLKYINMSCKNLKQLELGGVNSKDLLDYKDTVDLPHLSEVIIHVNSLSPFTPNIITKIFDIFSSAKKVKVNHLGRAHIFFVAKDNIIQCQKYNAMSIFNNTH